MPYPPNDLVSYAKQIDNIELFEKILLSGNCRRNNIIQQIHSFDHSNEEIIVFPEDVQRNLLNIKENGNKKDALLPHSGIFPYKSIPSLPIRKECEIGVDLEKETQSMKLKSDSLLENNNICSARIVS